MQVAEIENVFALDVRVITDVAQNSAVACATDDGCESTCASACSSGEED